jgi:hypothetical protein
MKRILLSLSLLITLPALATISYEAAQQQLANAQGRIKEINTRMNMYASKADGTLKAIQAVSGREQYSQDIAKRSELIQARINEREQLRSELNAAHVELQKTISEIGRRFPISANGNGEYTVGPRLSPIPANESSRYTAHTSTVR